jgi:polyhydroxyalkanoate synthesis regulator phasin
MSDRKVAEAEVEAKLAKGEAKLKEMKAELVKAGDSASDEAKDAVAAAEKLLDRGKKKYEELAGASDEKFHEVMDDAKSTWNDLTAEIEGGWDALSAKIKKMFS